MNRFDRITAILIQLQSKRVVKAQDMADRFGTSLRTIYRDIRTLEEAGVPLYGEAGVGYSLVEGYRLPPVMFSREEAMAFVTAEKLMEQFTDEALRATFASAMFKVRAVLRGEEKDLVEGLDDTIIVSKDRPSSAHPSGTLDVILKCAADKTAAELCYKAFGSEPTTRLIEPIGIFMENNYWYTIGYCHLRQNYRQFRIDRIVSVKATQTRQREHASLKEYREAAEKAKGCCELTKVVLSVSQAISPYLSERRHYFGFAEERQLKDFTEMTFYTDLGYEGFLRWFITFADYAEIIEPNSLKEDAIRLAAKISDKLKIFESC